MRRRACSSLLFLLVLLALTGCTSPVVSLLSRPPVEQHGQIGDTVTPERYTVTVHQVQYPATIAGLNLGLTYSFATTTPTSNSIKPRSGYRRVTFDVAVTATVRLDDGSSLSPSFTPRQPGLGILSPDKPSRGWLTFEVPSTTRMERLAISVSGSTMPGPAGEIVCDL